MKIKLTLLLLSVTLISGCTIKVGDESEPEQEIKQEITFNENESPYDLNGEIISTNYEICELYETVDKNELKYTYDNNPESYYFEYERGLAVMSPLQNEKSINDKKYKGILQAFSFASEINPINVTHDEAMDLAKKVLPEDIKLESKKDYLEMDDVGTGLLHFSSSEGNFLVHFAYGYGEDGNYDINNVAGITYLKEIDL